MLNTLFSTLFPETCPLCQERARDHRTAPICSACWQTVRPYRGPRCRSCSKPLDSDAAIRCSQCLHHDPGYASSTIYGLYEGALKESINHFKYFRKKRLLRPLAELMCTLDIPPVDVILPVPLHRSRLQERGFNQSGLIARQVAKKHSLPLLVNTLVRVRNTPQQVGLSSGKRKKNIIGAFSVRQGSAVTGRGVLLVDDVITTGATVQECSRELMRSGAGEVHVIALARGVQD